MNRNVEYKYHHIGIPTDEKRKGEKYSSTFKMYSYSNPESRFNVEWHRFEKDSTLPDLIKKLPHVAFKVDDISKALENQKVIFGPYFPFEGFCVAIIEDDGAPIELIQTDLTEEEVWNLPNKKEGSYLYPKK
ncbi:MAG: hypothetical protein GY750_14105 [Lentisphaerae bacterium]|nr:hypothetical protein [Lentisphaerota bacterium]MCP4102533.1 hypothetical protein [Lentisphaerota bacterium]